MSTPLSRGPLRVIQISDPHLFAERDERWFNVDTDASLKGVLDYIRTHEDDIDVVLATGDITQDGSTQAYQRFIELTQLAPILRGLPGNHDVRETFYAVWQDKADPVVDIGRWRLVLLDSSIPGSSAGHLASDQLDLLEDACKTADNRHVLVAVHHNPVPIGSGWLDTMMIGNTHALFGRLQNLTNVRVLIWGHVHQEFDSVYSFGENNDGNDGSGHDASEQVATRTPRLRLLGAPATSVQFTPRSQSFSLDSVDPGYRRLELHDDGGITTEVVRVPGLDIQPDTQSRGY